MKDRVPLEASDRTHLQSLSESILKCTKGHYKTQNSFFLEKGSDLKRTVCTSCRNRKEPVKKVLKICEQCGQSSDQVRFDNFRNLCGQCRFQQQSEKNMMMDRETALSLHRHPDSCCRCVVDVYI
jgi:hypothetical protein